MPRWACPKYEKHGADRICAACLRNFREQGNRIHGRDMAPRARFGRGWFGVGAAHFFEATDATIFPSKDGKRVLAAAICGAICEVTMAWAPTAESECRKCLAALQKLASKHETRDN